MSRRAILAAVVFSLVLFSTPWIFAGGQSLSWTGCGITKKAFMQDAAFAYKAETGVEISISGGGATKGVRATNGGSSMMGGTCRHNLPDRFPAEEGKVFLTVVGWDALVPIVHRANPVQSLTTDQLKGIMLGKITNWKEVGGPDKPIQVVARQGKISGVGFSARRIIFGDEGMDFSPRAMLLASSGPVEKKVASSITAIAVTGVSSAKRRPVKIVQMNGKKANVDNIASGSYPLFRPLYIATSGKPAGDVKKFLDWLTGSAGQAVVAKAGTVTIAKGAGLKGKYKYWGPADRVVNYGSLK